MELPLHPESDPGFFAQKTTGSQKKKTAARADVMPADVHGRALSVRAKGRSQKHEVAKKTSLNSWFDCTTLRPAEVNGAK